MKSALVFAVFVALATIASSQDLPTLPPDFDTEIIECVARGVHGIFTENAEQAHAVAIWTIELYRTVDGLIDHRRRCDAMTNSILQNTCMASWTAQVLLEANRLRVDLARITSQEVADEFYYHLLSCFSVDPDYVTQLN